MASGKQVLFVCPFGNAEAKEFVGSLAAGLDGWDITISDRRLVTFLFEAQKYDVAHFFLPASASKLQRFIRKGSRTKTVQTLISIPPEPENYKRSIFADAVVTFSEQERQEILRQISHVPVHTIPPCAPPQKIENLEAPQTIRERYNVQDRMFVIALNDFRDQEHFTTFLYTVREYQRRGGYRLLIPLYRQDRQSLIWRQKLQNAIDQEKLDATTLLETEVDVHSLIDAADITLLIDKHLNRPFSFPLPVVEALCAGKPVITYNLPPVREIIGEFHEGWLVKAYEDFSRISRDLLKQRAGLEELSTELAQFARARLSVEKVAERYKNLYNSLLSR
jgi:glycosyltransferase involved in cell wall biosynthesis